MTTTYGYLVRNYGSEIGDVYRLVFEMGDHTWEQWSTYYDLVGKAVIPGREEETNVFVTYIAETRALHTLRLTMRDDELRGWLAYLQSLKVSEYKGVGRPPRAFIKLTSYRDRLGLTPATQTFGA